MRIIINGMPKSGTHALQKWIGCGEIVHAPYGRLPPCDEHHFVTRHPRNVLLSQIRERGHRLVTPVIIQAIRHYDAGNSFEAVCSSYLPWLTVLNPVRFETLPVANRGGTSTWTGQLSRWQDVWSEEINRVWQATGCAAIEMEMGYGNA